MLTVCLLLLIGPELGAFGKKHHHHHKHSDKPGDKAADSIPQDALSGMLGAVKSLSFPDGGAGKATPSAAASSTPELTSKMIDENADVQPDTTTAQLQQIAGVPDDPMQLSIGVNSSMNTNLKSALDDIAPKGKPKIFDYPPEMLTLNGGKPDKPTNSDADIFANDTDTAAVARNGTSKSILYQVIDMGPYLNHRKYSVKFLAISGGYFASGILTIVLTICIVRKIARRKRNYNQYTLLTKRDMEFPLGGGGI